MDSRVYLKNELDSVKKLIIIFLLINFALFIFTIFKARLAFLDTLQLYLLVMLWASAFMLVVVACKKDWVVGLFIIFMVEFGVMVQSTTLKLNATGEYATSAYQALDIPKFLLVGSIVGIVFVLFHRFIYKDHQKYHYLYEIASAGLALTIGIFLLVKGSSANGAQLWITIIPGFSFQGTEFIKLLLLLFFASMFTNGLDVKKRYFISLIVLTIFFGIFALLNEFGTIMILFIVFSLACFIYLPKKYAWTNLGLMFLLLLLGLLVMKIICDPLYEADLQLQAQGLTPNVVMGLKGKIYKVYLRIVSCLDPWNCLADASYHINQAKKGMMLGGLFGHHYRPNGIYSAEADMAIAALTNSSGCILTIAVMFFFSASAILNLNMIAHRQNQKGLHQAQNMLFILSFVVQSFYCAFANIGYMPLTGIPIAFISNGGTAYILVLVYFFSILFLDDNYPEGRKRYE